MRADPDFHHPVDIGVIGPEDRIEGGISVVGHIETDPAVPVVVRLLVEAVEVFAVRVEAVGLRGIEDEDVGPRVARIALRLAKDRPCEGIHDLILKDANHADQLFALRSEVVTGSVEEGIALNPATEIGIVFRRIKGEEDGFILGVDYAERCRQRAAATGKRLQLQLDLLTNTRPLPPMEISRRTIKEPSSDSSPARSLENLLDRVSGRTGAFEYHHNDY